MYRNAIRSQSTYLENCVYDYDVWTCRPCSQATPSKNAEVKCESGLGTRLWICMFDHVCLTMYV